MLAKSNTIYRSSAPEGSGMAAKAEAKKTGQKPRRKAGNELIDKRAEAHSHHIRRKIMSYLTHMGPSGPSQIAKALNEGVNAVNYHMKRLVELNCTELAEIKSSDDRPPVKIYRLVELCLVDTRDWDKLDTVAKETSTGEALQTFLDEAEVAFKGGTLGTDGRHALIHQRLVVDELGLDEAVELEEEIMGKLQDLQARVAGRCAGNQPAITLSALNGCFRLPER
jgi:hypothetical protein